LSKEKYPGKMLFSAENQQKSMDNWKILIFQELKLKINGACGENIL